MDYRLFVLNRLLDQYEKSKHLTGNGVINRRVVFPFEQYKFPEYFADTVHSEKETINHEMGDLEHLGLITIKWIKSQKNHLIDKVYLSLDSVAQAYQMAGRTPLLDEIGALNELVSQYRREVQTEWICCFLNDMLERLAQKKIPQIIGKDCAVTDLLLRALRGIDLQQGVPMYERLFSKKYLGNSKYFEKFVRGKLIQIYKSYGITNSLADIYEIKDRESLLQEVGIKKMEEELRVHGRLSYGCNGASIDFAPFPVGVTMYSQLIKKGYVLDIQASRVLLIENKTVYLEYVEVCSNDEGAVESDEIVVYIGGFPGPDKREFLKQIQNFTDHENREIEFFFWGDIDLGGIKIYQHLKASVFPRLQPYQMDVATLLKYGEWGESFDSLYRDKLARLSDDNGLTELHELIGEMISNGIRLEQEAILL